MAIVLSIPAQSIGKHKVVNTFVRTVFCKKVVVPPTDRCTRK